MHPTTMCSLSPEARKELQKHPLSVDAVINETIFGELEDLSEIADVVLEVQPSISKATTQKRKRVEPDDSDFRTVPSASTGGKNIDRRLQSPSRSLRWASTSPSPEPATPETNSIVEDDWAAYLAEERRRREEEAQRRAEWAQRKAREMEQLRKKLRKS